MSEQNKKPTKSLKKYIVIFSGISAGVIAGYLYYFYVGCRTGACPLRANPYYNMLLGGLLGFIITDWIFSALNKKSSKTEKKSEEK